jgi:SAM-dependent methyltransferase
VDFSPTLRNVAPGRLLVLIGPAIRLRLKNSSDWRTKANGMFRFGFGDDNAGGELRSASTAQFLEPEPANGHTLSSSQRVGRAWIVPFPQLVDDDDGLPEVCDMVEFAEGEVQLRKCAAKQQLDGFPKESDLEAGSYEGGCKLWECAGDLIMYLHRSLKDSLRGASVLEIGAGHALPAVYAARAGASQITVADFNETVLKHVTSTNIRLNCEAHVLKQVCMVAGDWGGIPEALSGHTFEIVLASEVVYSVDAMERLADCILQVLRPGGRALIAGKTYYFGVGGGMRVFAGVLRARASVLNIQADIKTVEEFRDGKSNIREILQVLRCDHDDEEMSKETKGQDCNCE